MKLSIIILSVLFILASIMSVSAWLDCAPAACASGYTDNGIYCNGGECQRNCTAFICDATWTQVHTDTAFGINEFNEDDAQATSISYTPTNTSRCYQFVFDGPPAGPSTILMSVNDAAVCDSEAIGGFAQGATPWFSGVTGYIGTQDNVFATNMVSSMRAHSIDDSDATYESDASQGGYIYCAPNTIACGYYSGTRGCDTDCYNVATEGKVVQGYYQTRASPNATLYDGDRCGNVNVSRNLLNLNNFTVYEATAAGIDESLTTCDRTNEPPTLTNVLILPFNATAGHDLLCNYTYIDYENYTEQGSFFEWWRNGANQNINNSVLNYANLSAGDNWYCRVSPGDGLTNGTRQQSNTVSILSTVRNVTFSVENRQVWRYSLGYFAGQQELILNMTPVLNDALRTCTADAEGYCTLNLTFSSLDAGRINLTRLGIYYYTLDYPNETDARAAIAQGISTSALSSYLSYGDQQIYVRYLDNNQRNGTFDIVTIQGNQTWAFNFRTGNETLTNLTGLYNNSLVVWENESLTEDQITSQVSRIINQTRW